MTNEELETAVAALEAAADAATKKAYLAARLAGLRSRYLSLDLPVPPEVDALKDQVDADLQVEMVAMGRKV